jgi:hypothetical protein
MSSPQRQAARSRLLEGLGRTPTVGEVFEHLRESSQPSPSTRDDSFQNHELEVPADRLDRLVPRQRHSRPPASF